MIYTSGLFIAVVKMMGNMVIWTGFMWRSVELLWMQ